MLPLYVLGVVFLLMLTSNNKLHKNVYMDENALMAGNVQLEVAYHQHQLIDAHYEQLGKIQTADFTSADGTQQSQSENEVGNHKSSQQLLSYACSTMQAVGLRTQCLAERVTAVVDAKRSDGTECILIATNKKLSLSVMLTLMEMWKDATYLHKNIMLMVYSDPSEMQKFITEYHQHTSGMQRCGSIVAGLGLAFEARDFTAMRLEHVADNGLLPNMDVCATLMSVASDNVHVQVHLQNRSHQDVRHRQLKNMFHFLEKQFQSGIGTQNIMAPVTKYRIEAATMAEHWEEGARQYSGRDLAILVEHYVRSMNNLLERLHHSSSFYMLLDSRSFVAMGNYFAVVGLMAASMVVVIYRLWRQMGDSAISEPTQLWPLYAVRRKQMYKPFCIILMAFSSGVVVFEAPVKLAIPLSALMTFVTLIISGLVSGRSVTSIKHVSTFELQHVMPLEFRKVLLCMTMLILVICSLSISVLNFAIGLLLLSVYVPLLLAVNQLYCNAVDSSFISQGMSMVTLASKLYLNYSTRVGLILYSIAISPFGFMQCYLAIKKLPLMQVVQMFASLKSADQWSEASEIYLRGIDWMVTSTTSAFIQLDFAAILQNVDLTTYAQGWYVEQSAMAELLLLEWKNGIMMWPVITLIWFPLSILSLILLVK